MRKQFYAELGFTLNWEEDHLAEFAVGNFRFLLQKFYVKAMAESFMMHLLVDDADVWWARIQSAGMTVKYPGVMAKAPALQPWGLRVLYFSDPSGVLWHIAERKGA